MKPVATSLVLAISLIVSFVLLLESCDNSGGSDKNATSNKNASVGNNDTSFNCAVNSIMGDSTVNFLLDNNYDKGNNIYYNKDVATIYYTTSFVSYNKPKSGDGFYTISVMFQNMTGKEFSFSGNFNYAGRDTTINDISVPVKGTIDLGKIFTIHSMPSCESPAVSLNLMGNIIYH